MPPIRQVFVAILAIMLLAYGGIRFIGGYETANGLPINSTIAANYNAIALNTSSPGGFTGNITALGQAANTSAAKVNQTGSSSQSALINSVSLVLQFLTSIPAIMWSIVNFVSIPIAAVIGIGSLGYVQAVISIMFLGVLSLSIISAIFLFPIVADTGSQRKKRSRI